MRSVMFRRAALMGLGCSPYSFRFSEQERHRIQLQYQPPALHPTASV